MSLTAIARALGLSVTTVSRALGGFDDVAEATKARISAEAARINYQPNQAARKLRRGRAEAVGIVLPGSPGQFDDPFFLRLLASIGPKLDAAGLDLLVTTARPGSDEMRAYRHLVEGRRVDGLLVARTRIDDERIDYLRDRGFPFVVHGRASLMSGKPGFAFVDVDGEFAGRMATERLIGFGHRRIGLINAPAHFTFARHRQAGWHAALWDAQIAPGPIHHGAATEETGFVAANAMLAGPNAPTAIFCTTDRLAVGALHALAHNGFRAGRDVSIIGYDDLPVATYTDPPLTTIAQSIEPVAGRMMEMLLHLLTGGTHEGLQEVWQPQLIARASDGPAPQWRHGHGTRRPAPGEETHDNKTKDTAGG